MNFGIEYKMSYRFLPVPQPAITRTYGILVLIYERIAYESISPLFFEHSRDIVRRNPQLVQRTLAVPRDVVRHHQYLTQYRNSVPESLGKRADSLMPTLLLYVHQQSKKSA